MGPGHACSAQIYMQAGHRYIQSNFLKNFKKVNYNKLYFLERRKALKLDNIFFPSLYSLANPGPHFVIELYPSSEKCSLSPRSDKVFEPKILHL